MIGHLRVFFGPSYLIPRSGFYLGQVVRLSCYVILTGPVNATPTVTWSSPVPLPTPPVVYSAETGEFASHLIIDSFNSSHEGTYNCSASPVGFEFSVETQNVAISLNPNCM